MVMRSQHGRIGAGVSRKMLGRRGVLHAWAAGALLGCTAAVCAGPNLVPFGDFSDVPPKRFEGRDSFSGKEVIYEIDDPAYDFGRVVIRSSSPNSIVRRDLFVGFTGNGLAVMPMQDAQGNVQITEVELWFRLNGQLRPGARYEWEFYGGGENKVEGGFPALIPMFWADGEQYAQSVQIVNPESDPNVISRLDHFPRGSVRLPQFQRQSGPAWVVIKPAGYGQRLGIAQLSFREVDSDLAEGISQALPVPIKYIPIRSAVETQIAQALERSPLALRQLQNQDYYWNVGSVEQNVRITAKIVSAIMEATGTDADGRLRLAMDWLSRQKPPDNEDFSLPTIAARLYCLSRHGGMKAFSAAINADVQFLQAAQLSDDGWGPRSPVGGGEGPRQVRSDNEHTYLVVEALREAQYAGAPVDRTMWRRAATYWTKAQWYKGGFVRVLPERGVEAAGPTTAYTAVGAAGLLMTLDMAYSVGSRNCKEYVGNRALLRGVRSAIEWLHENYKMRFGNIIPLGQPLDPSLEPRALLSMMQLSGIGTLRNLPIFTEFANDMLAGFGPSSGMFGVRTMFGWVEAPNVLRTAEQLEILARGGAPLAVQRMVAGAGAEGWEDLKQDGSHLARYLSRTRGRHLNWRHATIDMGARELARVPITIVNVAGKPEWTEDQWADLRRYCFAGGTLVFVIDESGPAIRDEVIRLLKQTFPEYGLEAVPADDPVFTLRESIEGGLKVSAMGNGFRRFAFLAEGPWSCTWHQYEVDANVKPFAFINNLLDYNSDDAPLPSSFAESTYAIGSSPNREMTAVYLEVGGAVPAYPDMVDTLHRLMESTYRVRVVDGAASKDAPDLLWVGVTGPAAPSAEAKERILQQLKSGKYLFVDVISGDESWAENFAAAIKSMDSRINVERMPRRHSLFTGRIGVTQGFDVVNVAFRKELQGRFVKRGRCDLHEILWERGHAGAMSFNDVSSGLGYHFFPKCRGIMPEDARRMAMNVGLKALDRKQSLLAGR